MKEIKIEKGKADCSIFQPIYLSSTANKFAVCMGIRLKDEQLARINELFKKSKNEGLTEAEKEEQKTLRQQYIADVRRNLRGQLDNITIVD